MLFRWQNTGPLTSILAARFLYRVISFGPGFRFLLRSRRIRGLRGWKKGASLRPRRNSSTIDKRKSPGSVAREKREISSGMSRLFLVPRLRFLRCQGTVVFAYNGKLAIEYLRGGLTSSWLRTSPPPPPPSSPSPTSDTDAADYPED